MALTIKQIDDSLRSTGGFVTYTARNLNVTYSAIYARIQKSPQLQRTLKEVKESHLDLAEDKLITKIKCEDLGAIIWYLKCQGKKRGYVENPKDVTPEEDDKAKSISIEFVVKDARKKD